MKAFIKALCVVSGVSLAGVSWADIAGSEPFYYLPFADETDKISDWSLTCNNIETCYAEGYHAGDAGEQVASILLKKAAQNKITGLVKVDILDENGAGHIQTLTMTVNHKNLGVIHKNGDDFELNQRQINAIIQSIAKTGKASIKFRHGKEIWQVSDVGLKEVLGKIDEHLGVANTPFAILKKGNKKTLAKTARQKPVIHPKPVLTADTVLIDKNSAEGKKLVAFLTPLMKKEDKYCDMLEEDASDYLSETQFAVMPITKDKKLVTARCMTGAYNISDTAWVMNNDLTHSYQTIDSVNDVDGNRLSYLYKGRGIGDCWGGESWIWTGNRYEKTAEYHTGQCKGFVGGAWLIPSYITDVVGKKQQWELD